MFFAFWNCVPSDLGVHWEGANYIITAKDEANAVNAEALACEIAFDVPNNDWTILQRFEVVWVAYYIPFYYQESKSIIKFQESDSW